MPQVLLWNMLAWRGRGNLLLGGVSGEFLPSFFVPADLKKLTRFRFDGAREKRSQSRGVRGLEHASLQSEPEVPFCLAGVSSCSGAVDTPFYVLCSSKISGCCGLYFCGGVGIGIGPPLFLSFFFPSLSLSNNPHFPRSGTRSAALQCFLRPPCVIEATVLVVPRNRDHALLFREMPLLRIIAWKGGGLSGSG